MTIKHLFGREDTYVILTDYKQRDGEDGRGPHGKATLHHKDIMEASASWSLLPKSGLGLAVVLGRNGSESDLGLDLHLFRLGSLWLRIRSPWTRWANITDREEPYWYEARHYGFRAFSGWWRWVVLHLGSYEGMGPKVRRWREPSINKHTFLGRTRMETTKGMSGEAAVPMPEGDYAATWQEVTTITRYTAPLGRLRDRIRGPRTHRYIRLDIPGGIPVWGKGENSWDCGMDGTCGTSGETVHEAIKHAIDSTMRSRKRYGGPDGLPRPMTITEAEAHLTGRAS